jgi:toxin ParE1/3/4
MSHLIISPKAENDAEDIGDYIAKDNPVAALNMVRRLRELSVKLSENPMLGVKRDDIAKDLRYFPVGNYLILYRVLKDGIEVVRYAHGMRDLRRIPLK